MNPDQSYNPYPNLKNQTSQQNPNTGHPFPQTPQNYSQPVAAAPYPPYPTPTPSYPPYPTNPPAYAPYSSYPLPPGQPQPYPTPNIGSTPYPTNNPVYPPPQAPSYVHPSGAGYPSPVTSHPSPNSTTPAYPTYPNYTRPQSSQVPASYAHLNTNQFQTQPPIPVLIRKPIVKSCTKFDPVSDAKYINKAFKGIGCDDTTICKILTNRSLVQRLKIKEQYDKVYGTPLLKRMKSELYGERERLMKALIMMPDELDAYYIRVAVKHIGTDENCLNEILSTRNNQQIKNIAAAYYRNYGRDIVSDIKSDTSGNYKEALVELLKGNRKENTLLSGDIITSYVQDLVYSCKGLINQKGITHIKILCNESYETIYAINQQMCKTHGVTLNQHISKNFMGDLKNLLLDIAENADSQITYYVGRLMTAIKAMDVRAIGRILITRGEIDLGNILDEFEKYFKMNMNQAIEKYIPEIDRFMKSAFTSLSTSSTV